MEHFYKLVYGAIGFIFLVLFVVYEFYIKISIEQIFLTVILLTILFGFFIYMLTKNTKFRGDSAVSPENDLAVIADKYARAFYNMKTKTILSQDYLAISKRFFGYYCFAFLYKKAETAEHLENAVVIVVQFDSNQRPSIAYVRDDIPLAYFMKHKEVSQDRFENVWKLYSPYYRGAPTDKIKPEDELITRLRTPVKKYKIKHIKNKEPDIMREVSSESEETSEEREIEESEK